MASTIAQQGAAITMGVPYRVTVYTYLESQMAMNSIHVVWSLVSGPGSDQLGSVLQNWSDGNIDVVWKPMCATAAHLIGLKMTREVAPPVPLPGIITYNVACTGGSNPLPTQVTGLLKLQTVFAGRAYRGRMFTPFPAAMFVDADLTPTTAYTILLQNMYNAFIAPGTVTVGGSQYSYVPVLYHRKAGKGGIPAARSFDQIIDFTAEKLWATQRKRGDLGRLNVGFIS